MLKILSKGILFAILILPFKVTYTNILRLHSSPEPPVVPAIANSVRLRGFVTVADSTHTTLA